MQNKTELVASIKNFIEQTSGLKVREHETRNAYVLQLGITDPVCSKFNKENHREDHNEEPIPEEYKYYVAIQLLELWAECLNESNREATEDWIQATEKVN